MNATQQVPYPASRVSLLHGFSVNEVFRFACQLRSWFVLYAPGHKNEKLRDIKARANDIVKAKSHGSEKRLLAR